MMMMVMTAGPESNVRSSGRIQKFALGGGGGARDFAFAESLPTCSRTLLFAADTSEHIRFYLSVPLFPLFTCWFHATD